MRGSLAEVGETLTRSLETRAGEVTRRLRAHRRRPHRPPGRECRRRSPGRSRETGADVIEALDRQGGEVRESFERSAGGLETAFLSRGSELTERFAATGGEITARFAETGDALRSISPTGTPSPDIAAAARCAPRSRPPAVGVPRLIEGRGRDAQAGLALAASGVGRHLDDPRGRVRDDLDRHGRADRRGAVAIAAAPSPSAWTASRHACTRPSRCGPRIWSAASPRRPSAPAAGSRITPARPRRAWRPPSRCSARASRPGLPPRSAACGGPSRTCRARSTAAPPARSPRSGAGPRRSPPALRGSAEDATGAVEARTLEAVQVFERRVSRVRRRPGGADRRGGRGAARRRRSGRARPPRAGRATRPPASPPPWRPCATPPPR